MLSEFLQDILLDGWEDWIVRQRVYNKWNKVYWKYKDRNNQLRVLGEWYVADNLNYQYRNKGLHQSFKLEPMSYYMKYQYHPVYDKKRKPTGKRKNHGIDIYCRIVDDDNNSYSIGIEVCNWRGKYHSLNDYIYETRIRNKFLNYDKQNNMIHFITMNKRNIPLIQDRCDRDNINIIPMREHITPELIDKLISKGLIKPEFDSLQDIEYYTNNLTGEYLRVD
jgi:hypothetical protein